MKLNFFLVSFSVFYSKYSNCYKVPENMPIRYFDGSDWKIMKSREQIRIVPARPNISLQLDWPEFSEENNKTVSVCELKTTTTVKKISMLISKLRATTKRVTTKKVNNKVTNKVTTKATTKSCNSGCIIKKITIYKGIPRTIKISTTKKPNLKTTKRPPAKTTKKFVITTKKPLPRITKKPAVIVKKPILNGKNGSLKEQGLPNNWLSVIKDLVDALKVVEEKKNNNKCPTESTSQLNAQYPLVDGRRVMEGMDDIMTLLMDGVEIDRSPDDVNGNGSDYSVLLPGFRGFWEDEDKMLDLNDIENIFATRNLNDVQNKDPILNKNNVQNLNLESIKDALKARYSKGGDGNFLQNREIKTYLDLLKSRYEKKDILEIDDAPLNLAAINAVIETKHPDKLEFREQAEYKDSFKESDLKTYLDAHKSEGIKNKAIKAYLDLLKSRHITRDISQNDDALLDLDTVDPGVENHNLKNTGIRELVEYEDTALESDLKSYLDTMNGRDATKNKDKTLDTKQDFMVSKHPDYSELKKQDIHQDDFKGIDLSPYLNAMNSKDDTKNTDKTLETKEVFMETIHPDSSELKKQEIINDDFQGLDLSPYLNAMNAKYAAKSRDRFQDTHVKNDKYIPETISLNLDEIAALIGSKHSGTSKTNEPSKHKQHLKNKDIKNFFNAMTSFHFKKDKNISHNRDKTLDLDGTNEENNLNGIDIMDEDKQNDNTDIKLEDNGFATDNKDEPKETGTQEGLEEDVDGPGPNFKYILDDGEQNETIEDNAFTWDDGGERFQRPEMRPTLAP